MGCDIHVHVEIKVNGKWEHYSAPKIDRLYHVFDLLAGVHGDDEPIIKPRGLPDSLSEVTKIDWRIWHQDSHHISWLSSPEVSHFVNVAKNCGDIEYSSAEVFGYVFGNSIESYVKHQRILPQEVEDVRVVFWFDN